jgi:hypothetical protein
MFRTLSRTLILVALALLFGALAPAQAEEASPASPAPASVAPGACDLTSPLTFEQEPVFLTHRPGDCSCTQNSDCESVCFDGGTCVNGQCQGNTSFGCDCCGGTAPGECDDCMGGCSFSCCSDSDCESQCPFGIGSCTTENKCLCAC